MKIQLKHIPWSSLSPRMKAFYIFCALVSIASSVWQIYDIHKLNQEEREHMAQARARWQREWGHDEAED